MTRPLPVKKIPWDTVAFGFDCYEIEAADIAAAQITTASLIAATRLPGHYSLKITTTAPAHLDTALRSALHGAGFYYCDTLITPYCAASQFHAFPHTEVSLAQTVNEVELLAICHGAFTHGRFHRDFNIAKNLADSRYDNWLKQLIKSHAVTGLQYGGEAAGFIAHQGAALVLHAVAEKFRGRGLAKYLWMPLCQKLFEDGYAEITSSVSAANLGAVNLYASLGFRFRRAVECYHRVTP